MGEKYFYSFHTIEVGTSWFIMHKLSKFTLYRIKGVEITFVTRSHTLLTDYKIYTYRYLKTVSVKIISKRIPNQLK